MEFSPRTIVVRLGLCIGVLLAASAAFAEVSAVTASPSTVYLATGQPSTITIVWRVDHSNMNACQPTITSAASPLRAGNANGPILFTVPALLRTDPCPALNTTRSLVVVESITVPSDVAKRAQELGFPNVYFARSFSDGTSLPIGAAVNMPLTSPAVAGFNVARVELAFAPGTATRVLGLNEALTAIADLSFVGSGLLQAQWEVASPETTAGTPVFRPLAQVREYLAGGETRELRSPPLPTHTAGLYFLRLRITDPQTAFEAPVIRYFVTSERPAATARARTLALGDPPPRALLAPDTAFVWEAVPGARAYQLEVYALESASAVRLPDLTAPAAELTPTELTHALSRPPVTGTLVSARQTRAGLSTLSRQHLAPGRRYAWRVLAIGVDGTVIATSPVRELRTP